MAATDAVKADWPLFGLTDDIRPALEKALADREPSALVTLYAATGGSPRGIGAQMVVTRNDVSGYVSGGCVEADVVRHALDCLDDHEPRRLVYGQGGPIDIQLPCGGRIELLVERVAPGNAAARNLVEAGRHRVVWASDGRESTCLPATAAQGLAAGGGRAGLCADGARIFRIHDPRTRLIVVGSDPSALAMAMMAGQVGWEVHLVRPKGPATPPPVQGIRYWRDAPGTALAAIGLDPWSAVAVATHQEEDDHDALCAALQSSAGYVGLLGSTRKLPAKRARLLAAGVSPDRFDALRAPIGLPSGPRSPWGIATGVIAEVGQTLEAAARAPAPALHTVAAA